MTSQPNPDPPEAMKPTPANPENVPLDKIPAGWRLLYEGEYRSNLPTRLWFDEEIKSEADFCDEIEFDPSERNLAFSYITPDLPDNGQPWHAHKPGDPAPVAIDVKVDIVCKNGGVLGDGCPRPNWADCGNYGILFYRLHDPATTFEAHGHTWFKHTPGDPMPCDRDREVDALFEDGETRRALDGVLLGWGTDVQWKIIGWRYAEPKPVTAAEDPVNLPTHYRSHPSGVECIEVTEHMNFCLGNAVKYLWRAGLKSSDTHLEDLRKARWYLDREITRIEKQQAKNTQP